MHSRRTEKRLVLYKQNGKEEEEEQIQNKLFSSFVFRIKQHKNPQPLETSQFFSLHYCITFFFPDVLELVAMQPSFKPHHLIILLLIAI